ncbi:MBL fold metallo-hydrolase [Marinobacterium arenosum]|uniref:MBL fold metallo-hydrolase n=1 Tax=Marinobacterium arenosum TaxID=2862496 RepID=UPI001C949B54|nr:MBL fold metallo-hydrolase [Marinobacterium arenosum]MBY4678270.1 MBL fold metallo-hydrolase [Marinobacterium arenosum]
MNAIISAFPDVPATGDLQQVAPGVLWLKMPLPFALDHINLYLIDDCDGWVAVDSGLAGEDSRNIWRQILSRPLLLGKPLKQLIVTHFHPDHLGGAGWLCQHFNLPLAITGPEYETAAAFLRDAGQAGDYRLQRLLDYFHGLGMSDEIAQRIINATDSMARAYDPLPGQYQQLEQGTLMKIGGRDWQVSVADGHSPAHATLYCAELNLLISGDQVLPRISSNVSVRIEAPQANPLRCWLKALERLHQLPDDTLVLPAHDQPFYGLHRRLDQLTEEHRQMLELVEQSCRQPKTVMELLPIMYSRKLGDFDLLLASGECLAHLHYLIEQQLIVRQVRTDGVVIYLRVSR